MTSPAWEDPAAWTDPGVALRIMRWADAPEHLRELVADADYPDWLAWVPDAKRADAEGDFGWAEATRADDPNGNLVVAGQDPA